MRFIKLTSCYIVNLLVNTRKNNFFFIKMTILFGWLYIQYYYFDKKYDACEYNM